MKPELSRKLDEELRAKQKKEQSQPKPSQVEGMTAEEFLISKGYKKFIEIKGKSVVEPTFQWETVCWLLKEYANIKQVERREITDVEIEAGLNNLIPERNSDYTSGVGYGWKSCAKWMRDQIKYR
jgi:hypothetical protein